MAAMVQSYGANQGVSMTTVHFLLHSCQSEDGMKCHWDQPRLFLTEVNPNRRAQLSLAVSCCSATVRSRFVNTLVSYLKNYWLDLGYMIFMDIDGPEDES